MNVKFNDDAKQPLMKGCKLISDAVAVTFGPNGKNVIIQGVSDVYATKDGATVAKYVNDPDPLIGAGISIIRDIATKTAKDVGDGTSTSTILANSIIENLSKSKMHPIEIQRALDRDVKKVIEYLDSNKKEIETKEDLLKVATIATNNDPILGELVAETYSKVGKDGVVTIEESSDINDHVEYTNGMRIDTGFTSPYFINTNKGECELTNVLVGVFDFKVKKVEDIQDIAEQAIKEKKSLLLIAPEFDSSVSSTLLLNKEKFESCCVTSPAHGVFRDALLADVKCVIGESKTCDKIIITKTTTTLIGTNISEEIKQSKIIEIKEVIKDVTTDFEKEFHSKRLANYNGGIATIFVGGYSQLEISEKKDRIEDAVCAVKAALISGVLPGGGRSLYFTSYHLKLEVLEDVLRTPMRLLIDSSNIEEVTLGDKFWDGYDFKNNKQGDMYEMGVIDPFLVTKISLENAVSAAALILTTGCSIICN